jgi:RNA polymerase sigma-70 factor (ECF subfamily)
MLSKATASAPELPPAEGTGTARSTADRARLEEMFASHHNVVWRTLRRCGLDADGATEVGQQAFLIAVERVADIWPGSERAFLVGTALRLGRTARRKQARAQLDDDMDRHLGGMNRVEDSAAALQLIDLALANIDPTLVQVFVLFDVEGFSAPEIAQALDIPLGTVASRLRRAREEFRASARRLQSMFEREEGRGTRARHEREQP